MLSEFRAWALMTVCAAAAGPAAAAIDASAPDGSTIKIDVRHGKVVGEIVATQARPLQIDSKVTRLIVGSEAFFAVGKVAVAADGKTWLLVVTQTPSRENHAAGACGSGTEDALHLMQVDASHRKLILRSTIPLQSCLTGLSLNDDSGQPLQQKLESVSDPRKFELQWLNHPKYGNVTRTLTILDGEERVQ